MTYNEELDITEVGLCIYNFIHDNESSVNEVYHSLPPNTSVGMMICAVDLTGLGLFAAGVMLKMAFVHELTHLMLLAYNVPMASLTGRSMCCQRICHLLFPTLLFCVSIHSSHLQGYII